MVWEEAFSLSPSPKIDIYEFKSIQLLSVFGTPSPLDSVFHQRVVHLDTDDRLFLSCLFR